jgi:hypothetical protein
MERTTGFSPYGEALLLLCSNGRGDHAALKVELSETVTTTKNFGRPY